MTLLYFDDVEFAIVNIVVFGLVVAIDSGCEDIAPLSSFDAESVFHHILLLFICHLGTVGASEFGVLIPQCTILIVHHWKFLEYDAVIVEVSYVQLIQHFFWGLQTNTYDHCYCSIRVDYWNRINVRERKSLRRLHSKIQACLLLAVALSTARLVLSQGRQAEQVAHLALSEDLTRCSQVSRVLATCVAGNVPPSGLVR